MQDKNFFFSLEFMTSHLFTPPPSTTHIILDEVNSVIGALVIIRIIFVFGIFAECSDSSIIGSVRLTDKIAHTHTHTQKPTNQLIKQI